MDEPGDSVLSILLLAKIHSNDKSDVLNEETPWQKARLYVLSQLYFAKKLVEKLLRRAEAVRARDWPIAARVLSSLNITAWKSILLLMVKTRLDQSPSFERRTTRSKADEKNERSAKISVLSSRLILLWLNDKLTGSCKCPRGCPSHEAGRVDSKSGAIYTHLRWNIWKRMWRVERFG